ncbi:hypothetical protein [Arachidicoccus soli]|uniref:Uncharacterized protein n=1 Tax=Arachidicoccus soli TaxID=2341117 RepID=A0A386HTP9_9BACT|nr:hypothetical protein [Arachidicoccus soli]AYD49049.1 hypothetical protein D6B99_16360 [Arachidicoccus soli]
MKKFPKLSLAQLASEMLLTTKTEEKNLVGGYTPPTPGISNFDCFFQCLSYISGNSVSYYENQYEAFCGNSYYDPSNPNVWYSPEAAYGNSNLIPVYYDGVSLSNESQFTSQFFSTSTDILTGGYNQTTVDYFNNLLSGGSNMILSAYQGTGGHAVVVQHVDLSYDNQLVFTCYDPQNNQAFNIDTNGVLYPGASIANIMIMNPY